MISFFVEGPCVPKGNHTAFPMVRGRCPACKPGKPCRRRVCVNGMLIGATVTDDGGAELKAWEQLVNVRAASARNAARERMQPRGVAMVARFIFAMPRPQGHYLTDGSFSAEGKRHMFPTTRPDFDKLTRAAADGMTGVLYEDDSQVAHAPITKLWATDALKIGVLIQVEKMERIPGDVLEALAYAGVKGPNVQTSLL